MKWERTAEGWKDAADQRPREGGPWLEVPEHASEGTCYADKNGRIDNESLEEQSAGAGPTQRHVHVEPCADALDTGPAAVRKAPAGNWWNRSAAGWT